MKLKRIAETLIFKGIAVILFSLTVKDGILYNLLINLTTQYAQTI